jgi:excisionase family DNA binding protein
MRVSTRVIRKWADAGKIECYRTIGGHRLFPISEVRRVLDELRGRKHTV